MDIDQTVVRQMQGANAAAAQLNAIAVSTARSSEPDSSER